MSSVRRCIHMKILFPLNVIHRFLAFALRRETGSGWSGLVHQSGKSFLSSPWRTFKAQRRCIAISFPPWRRYKQSKVLDSSDLHSPRRDTKKMPKLFSLSRGFSSFAVGQQRIESHGNCGSFGGRVRMRVRCFSERPKDEIGNHGDGQSCQSIDLGRHLTRRVL